jgi:hypothetical protein
MTKETMPAEAERVFCEVCLKRVPKSAAVMAEAKECVAYFCGSDCYGKWSRQRQPAARAVQDARRNASALR